MKKLYLSFVDLIAFLENIIASFALIFATFSTIWQIVNRYWLHYEIMWVGDFTLYVFVLGVITIIAMTTRENAHTSVDIIASHIFKYRIAGGIFKVFINLCSIAAIILPLPNFYKYFLNAMKFPEWGTLCPWFNTSWLVEAIFIMLVLCIFHIAHNTGVVIIGLFSGGAQKGADAQ